MRLPHQFPCFEFVHVSLSPDAWDAARVSLSSLTPLYSQSFKTKLWSKNLDYLNCGDGEHTAGINSQPNQTIKQKLTLLQCKAEALDKLNGNTHKYWF